ncbi:HAD family hydrolase [Anaerobacillus alkaliphilus]|uniref:HAD family hydrolase n=1 Tax=Anaerobacillus alkaliphilus TaxID=1548597 RepID=A0A4V1LG60_9BACI|nr:HAD-IA family hydrolase [Anaerobacillus alkaliphilus]RXI98634.1 HAD family hydrolase [Anaerobacillus alkaliphilus]
MKYKGVMFDMDNTILQSNIDFKRMKEGCKKILVANQVDKWKSIDSLSTTSQLIELGKKYELVFGDQNKIVEQMLAVATVCETEGMRGATLEKSAQQVLQVLSYTKTLVIVTNNATKAARVALNDTGVNRYFDQIFGREQFPALKPSSEAIITVLEQYPGIPASDWVMVGDSWIDGKAAEGARVDFIAYQMTEDKLIEHKIQPVKVISNLRELV